MQTPALKFTIPGPFRGAGIAIIKERGAGCQPASRACAFCTCAGLQQDARSTRVCSWLRWVDAQQPGRAALQQAANAGDTPANERATAVKTAISARMSTDYGGDSAGVNRICCTTV